MSITYDAVYLPVTMFTPDSFEGPHTLVRPLIAFLRSNHLPLIHTSLRRTLEYSPYLLLHRDFLISTHFISETKRLSFSYSYLLSFWRRSKRMKAELDTHAHKHISYSFTKTNFLFSYTRAQRRGWRLVCKRDQGPPSVSRPIEAGKGKGKGERRAVVVYHHQDLYPSLHYLCFF